uniref:Uncharacterized protein n=1 Tax=Prevotella sp. GTC17260 TaxID=3236796 RepID=A0AB33JH92_9BACT
MAVYGINMAINSLLYEVVRSDHDIAQNRLISGRLGNICLVKHEVTDVANGVESCRSLVLMSLSKLTVKAVMDVKVLDTQYGHECYEQHPGVDSAYVSAFSH